MGSCRSSRVLRILPALGRAVQEVQGGGAGTVRHHGVGIQEAVGRKGVHPGTQHSFGTYQRKIISFLAQEAWRVRGCQP